MVGIVNSYFLQDVCVSSARVASEFYHAARDSILLYEAVVPVKVSENEVSKKIQ